MVGGVFQCVREVGGWLAFDPRLVQGVLDRAHPTFEGPDAHVIFEADGQDVAVGVGGVVQLPDAHLVFLALEHSDDPLRGERNEPDELVHAGGGNHEWVGDLANVSDQVGVVILGVLAEHVDQEPVIKVLFLLRHQSSLPQLAKPELAHGIRAPAPQVLELALGSLPAQLELSLRSVSCVLLALRFLGRLCDGPLSQHVVLARREPDVLVLHTPYSRLHGQV